MQEIKCLAISPGIAVGPLFFYSTTVIKAEKQAAADPEQEIRRLEEAIEQAKVDLQAVLENSRKDLAGEAEIFEAHLMVLDDPVLLEQVAEDIRGLGVNAEYAWQQGMEKFAEMMASMEDEYMAARAADVRDVSQRVLRVLAGEQQDGRSLAQPSIIVAHELTPSDTVTFDRSKVLAFCTAEGGPTSHVSILSKALGIPAVSGLGQYMEQLRQASTAVVDGSAGKVILNPDEATQRTYISRRAALDEKFKRAFQETTRPAVTRDGKQVEVVANIGSVKDAREAVKYGAEGVGLLRTEFLFLDRTEPPTEEEQYSVYRQILEVFGDRPVVARTLDIGGDKPASYLHMNEELNPFLGVRGARLELQHEELMIPQLRALLRAGEGHNLKIMFPMISTIGEIRQANEYVRRVKGELEASGTPYARNAEIGIMVEVPSAAINADILAKEVDFFSIGTNDLSQYTLAGDRTNPHVAHLADSMDPSVLRLIGMVCKAAHEAGIWVGLCGELGGEVIAAPVLLGLGVDELSMNPRAIPFVKEQIRRYTVEEAQRIASHVLGLSSAADIRAYLTSLLPDGG